MMTVLFALAAAATGATPAMAPADPALGTWVNPRHTLEVRTSGCGDRLCGTIVRASVEAQNDARDGGVPQLIGTQLLQDYRRTSAGEWSGRVFVPDMGRSFSSVIDLQGQGALKISGCLIGHMLCRSQIWTRAPHAD